jgi:predicted ATPase
MERAAGFEASDDAKARLGKLDALLAQISTSPQDKAIFADLLSLPSDGRYPKLDLPPQERRRRTIDAITRRLEVLARQQPVLAIFEDLHWIDPTSLDVLKRMIDRGPSPKLLEILRCSSKLRSSPLPESRLWLGRERAARSVPRSVSW